MRKLVSLLLFAATWALAEDITGIWTGQTKGRNGELEDIAFQFKQTGGSLTGTMFGDEFDIKVEEASVQGDRVKFVVTMTNYYSNNKTRFLLSGVLKGNEMELTRERVPGPDDKPGGPKQIIKLKRLI